MDIDEFKQMAAKCEMESEVDSACFAWLKSVAVEYGKSGKIAIKLLDVVKDIINE